MKKAIAIILAGLLTAFNAQAKNISKESEEILNLMARSHYNDLKSTLQSSLGVKIHCNWDDISEGVNEGYDKFKLGNYMNAGAKLHFESERVAYCGVKQNLERSLLATKVGRILGDYAKISYVSTGGNLLPEARVSLKNAIILLSEDKNGNKDWIEPLKEVLSKDK
jgi:hypothetical protein